MKASLWTEHILPFTFVIGLLALATLVGDYILHRLDLVWIGSLLVLLHAGVHFNAILPWLP